MFKPSLKKSVLDDQLCFSSNSKSNLLSNRRKELMKSIPQPIKSMKINSMNESSSMMIAEQILQKKTFTNKNNFSHAFSPLSYNFKAYPEEVKQLIKQNATISQFCHIKQINLVVHKNRVVLWKYRDNKAQKVKTQKFPFNIHLAQFSILRNINLFKYKSMIVLALTFDNKVSLYRVNEQNLQLQDLMLHYKIGNCNKIHKMLFSKYNELILCGDDGQVRLISFSSLSTCLVSQKRSWLQRYFSKKSFDFTQYEISDLCTSGQYIYVLRKHTKKSSFMMYCIKSFMNNIVRLENQPTYIHQEVFVDVYLLNKDRQNLTFIDSINEKQVANQAQHDFDTFKGHGVDDAFSIVKLRAQTRADLANPTLSLQANDLNKLLLQQKFNRSQSLTLVTKCGYLINLFHLKTARTEKKTQQDMKQKFVFGSSPIRLPEIVEQDTTLMEGKTLKSDGQSQRKNQVVNSLGNKNMTLMNNMLIYLDSNNLNMLKATGLRPSITQCGSQEKSTLIMDWQIYKDMYQSLPRVSSQNPHQFNSFGKSKATHQQGQIVMENYQRRWILFGDQGQVEVARFQPRHLLLVYLAYKLQLSSKDNSMAQMHDQQFITDCDIQMTTVVEKLIRIYGTAQFIRSLIQILVYNHGEHRQYFWVQKQLLQQIVKRQLQYQMPLNFSDWSYKVNSESVGLKIVVCQKIRKYIWLLLLQYHQRGLSKSQIVHSEPFSNPYLRNLSLLHESQKWRPIYSAYGYALQSFFYDQIESILNLRAKQYKSRGNELEKCQWGLISLLKMLEEKREKFESHQYRGFLSFKLRANAINKRMNNTSSTNSSFNDDLFNPTQQTNQSPFRQNSYLESNIFLRSNIDLEKLVVKGIDKITSLFNVMKILSEKDERFGLPNLRQILTNYKHQIKVGQQFFKQELIVQGNKTQFVHPQLVRQVQSYLPQLSLASKLQYLVFKQSRNISNQLAQNDLNNLDFQRLSAVVQSTDIPQLRSIFVGTNKFNQSKYFLYLTFLLTAVIKYQNALAGLIAHKEISLGQLTNQTKMSQTKSLALQKLICSEQRIEYFEGQLSAFVDEIKYIFTKTVDNIKQATGPSFYSAQQYLDYTIQVLVEHFFGQELIIQYIQLDLRRINFNQKVYLVKKLRQSKRSGTKRFHLGINHSTDQFKHSPDQYNHKTGQYQHRQKSTFQQLSEKISLEERTTDN